eukprot:COSAG05_NODE_3208_length_2242_cov_3.339171_2_plen_93_part_00
MENVSLCADAGTAGKDHIAMLQQMGQAYTYLDLTRVGIYGHSAVCAHSVSGPCTKFTYSCSARQIIMSFASLRADVEIGPLRSDFDTRLSTA